MKGTRWIENDLENDLTCSMVFSEGL